MAQTLADAFLADLGEELEEEEAEEQEEQDDTGEKQDEELGEERSKDKGKGKEPSWEEVDVSQYEDVRSIAHLLTGDELQSLLKTIEENASKQPKSTTSGPIEADPEYGLIVRCTEMTAKLSDELQLVHKFVRDHYAKKFPELESLVLNPLDYAKAVKRIGNETDLTVVNLSDILPPATVMVVSVTASTTEGTPLPESKMERIVEGCDEIIALDTARQRILGYVESRMSYIAPNLSIIVGTSIAAKLMGAAGGLTALSKMPSGNVQILGSKKRALGGFASISLRSHTGFIDDCEILQHTPQSLKMKARRLMAGKCTLAARVDSFHDAPEGACGRKLRQEIEKKINKWQEPPPPKAPKPLPVPDQKAKKKRGGARMRRMKEKYAVTEVRKQANRMAFGPDVEDSSYGMGQNFGMLGKSGSGKIRVAAENKNLLLKNKRRKTAGGATTVGGASTATSGMASSLAFTPVQGFELEDPLAAARKVQQANEKYFSATSGFAKVIKRDANCLKEQT
ncbi:U4/U6 small nuclear ribonucleoprotein Prp31 [Balamuthia mandrillaris]